MVDSETSTSLPGLSRRDVLSTLTAAVSSATVGHPSAKQMLTAPRQDPALVAWQSWHTASRRALALCRKQQRLETELIRTIGFPSITLNLSTLDKPVQIATVEAFEDLAVAEPSIRYLRNYVEAELFAQEAKWDAADRRIGYSAAVRAEELALSHEERLAAELFAADALTIPGVIAKLEALIALDAPSEDADERPWPQLRRIRAELIHMYRRHNGAAA
ncbi:hypothetical protein ACN6KF_005520 [Labrys sp. La1]|uniref:hypothetical protein n=1 Tax=Labrys sp. La1 TaxID=3404917 RepID=UPI003EC05055